MLLPRASSKLSIHLPKSLKPKSRSGKVPGEYNGSTREVLTALSYRTPQGNVGYLRITSEENKGMVTKFDAFNFKHEVRVYD